MVCGKQAQVVVAKDMSHVPRWVWIFLLLGLFPIVIAVVVAIKRARLRAPMCQAHKRHWSNRSLAVTLTFICLLPLIYVSIQSAAAPERVKLISGAWVGTFVLFTVLCVLLWLGTLIWLSHTAIRPLVLSDSGVVLLNVAPEFIDAVVQLDTYRADDKAISPTITRERRTSTHIQASRGNSGSDGIQS